MRKYLQLILVLGIFFLVVYLKNLKVSKLLNDDEEGSRIVAPKQTPIPSVTQPAAPQTSATSYKDGSYTGTVEDAFYGNLQVKAVISGGKIVDVIALQYPNDNRTSIQINSQAIPFLRQETLQAQSAQIDMISGASDSSPAFIRSLSNALSQAK